MMSRNAMHTGEECRTRNAGGETRLEQRSGLCSWELEVGGEDGG